MGFFAAVAVLMPGLLRQEQFRVEHRHEVAVLDGQMHRDDAVVDLARCSAMLTLHARSFVPFFCGRGLVNPADRAHIVHRAGTTAWRGQVVADDPALNLIPHPGVIPGVMGKELLQRTHGRTGGQGDWLNTLARQITEQPPAINTQVLKSGKTGEEFVKAAKELGQSRPQAGNLIFGHRPPCPMKVIHSRPLRVEQF